MRLRIIGQITLFSAAAGLAALAGCSDDESSSSNGGNGGAGGTGGATSSSSSSGQGGGMSNCGDGVMNPGEACDDGNTTADDGCDSMCEAESGWSCDGEPSVCTEICADGLVVGAEACDDGNSDTGDGCDDACTVEAGYTCDGSPSVCGPTCGDGVILGFMGGGGGAGGMGGAGGGGPMPLEACDDGNTDAGDGCSDLCVPEAGWDCAGEPSSCTSICGDGIVVGTEVCDDGNIGTGDGCDDACLAETGWNCTGEPSVCDGICGDGLILGTEACDDNNTVDLDGCDMMCAVEAGHFCNGEPSVCSAGEVVSATMLNASFGDTGFPANHCESLVFSSAGTVNGPVELVFALSHTFIGDLSITIASPTATITTLMDQPGTGTYGDSSNLSSAFPLTFSATGVTDADNMGVNIAGTDDVVCQDDQECSFFPNPGSMAAFNGETVAGTWTVCFNDSYGTLDLGVLESVSLTVPITP